jgi:hypothetical protein
MDPYVVCAAIIDTTLLEESKLQPLVEQYQKWKEWVKTAEIADC